MKEENVKETAITALRQKLAAVEAENALLRAAIEANNALVNYSLKVTREGKGNG